MKKSKKSKKSSSRPSSPQMVSTSSSPSTETTTEAVASLKARNLYHMSLVCFSFTLILFAATYVMIADYRNSGGVVENHGYTLEPDEFYISVQDTKDVEDSPIDLLSGYKILHDTLRKESRLKYLHVLRDATFRGPKGSLKSVFKTIYETSAKRQTELENLWRTQEPALDPNRDAPHSAMGASIQANVEQSSKGELVPLPKLGGGSNKKSPPHHQWGVRFVLIQAQATRMVVALASSLETFEPNEARRQWLADLADEYEGIRESLVDCLLSNLGEDSFREA